MAGTTTHRQFGSLRKLPSGRYQAAFTGPDGQRHKAPATFRTKAEAAVWLDRQRLAIVDQEWTAPVAKPVVVTFGPYADEWLAGRVLKPRTRVEYRRLLDGVIFPAFKDEAIKAITPAAVRAWHTQLEQRHPNAPISCLRLAQDHLGHCFA